MHSLQIARVPIVNLFGMYPRHFTGFRARTDPFPRRTPSGTAVSARGGTAAPLLSLCCFIFLQCTCLSFRFFNSSVSVLSLSFYLTISSCPLPLGRPLRRHDAQPGRPRCLRLPPHFPRLPVCSSTQSKRAAVCGACPCDWDSLASPRVRPMWDRTRKCARAAGHAKPMWAPLTIHSTARAMLQATRWPRSTGAGPRVPTTALS